MAVPLWLAVIFVQDSTRRETRIVIGGSEAQVPLERDVCFGSIVLKNSLGRRERWGAAQASATE